MKDGIIEIRFHGRGGQGAVTSAELLTTAAIDEGKFGQAFPSFGPERRGAPVMAFSRVSDNQIRTRCQIYEPDIVVVLDSSLLSVVDVCEGLKPGGMAVVNSTQGLSDVRSTLSMASNIAVVDATKIARKCLGRPITNTTMLGALIKATDLVKLDSLAQQLKTHFGIIAERNVNAMRMAYDEVKIEENDR